MKPKVTQKGSKKRGKGPTRDEKGRFISPINGQPVPDSEASRANRFKPGDDRAREASKKGVAARRERGDLRRLCQAWMETEFEDTDGQMITGGEKMVQVAAQQLAKGNPRFWEMMRDTAGFKPMDKVMVADVDPFVVKEVEEMVLGSGDDPDE